MPYALCSFKIYSGTMIPLVCSNFTKISISYTGCSQEFEKNLSLS